MDMLSLSFSITTKIIIIAVVFPVTTYQTKEIEVINRVPHSTTVSVLASSKTKTPGKQEERNCCKNGGRCIMGSFCFCPSGFFGRYCEHQYTDKRCGPIKSGQTIRSDCNLCQCFDGKFMCIPNVFAGCEDSDYVEADSIDPLLGKNIEIVSGDVKPEEMLPNLRMRDDHMNHEDYFEEYEESSAFRKTSSFLAVALSTMTLTVAFAVCGS